MKKGEIVSDKLVGITILIVGAVLIISLFYFIDWKTEISRESCHDSVVLRGTLPDTLGAKNLPSLNCDTKKLCITNKLLGSGNCKRVFGKDFNSKRISKEEDFSEDINKIIATEIADCWSMMGEGKIQIFERESVSKKRCVICTRIAFDDSIKIDHFSGLDKYLLLEKVPQKDISFVSYLKLNPEDLKKLSNGLTTKEKAIVFFEIDNSDFIEDFFTGAGSFGLGGASLILTKSFKLSGTMALVGGWIGSSAGGFIQDELNKNLDYVSGYALIDYDEKNLRELDCHPF